MTQSKKQFRFDVDQSVRIEELNRDSVIGIANSDRSLAYVIPRKTKRYFNELFRRQGKPRQCAPAIFAASIVASLRLGKISPSIINIDIEYLGYGHYISEFINDFYPHTVIAIRRIGRSSLAHAAAYNTHLKHRDPDGIIPKTLLGKIIFNKKTAAEPHRLGLTRVHKSKQPVNKKRSNRK